MSCSFQDIYSENPDVTWDDIIGLDHAKRLVKESVVYPIRVSILTLLLLQFLIKHWLFQTKSDEHIKFCLKKPLCRYINNVF